MTLPRILIVHNRYRFPGGEDTVVETEAALLRSRGHEVRMYIDYNEALLGETQLQRIRSLAWSTRTTGALSNILETFRPDVVHCHNTFYRISPAVFWLCSRRGIPVVKTLHNFRLGCVNARLSRNGRPCDVCIRSSAGFLHAVRNRCFQHSAWKTFALGGTIAAHRHLGTYSAKVAAYICLCECARRKHILCGLPEGKLLIKPNCVHPDPGIGSGGGSSCLFVGRLEEDKGVRILLDAASQIIQPVWIAGQGPLESEVREAAAKHSNIRYLGPVSRDQVFDLMKSARLLIFPSLAYENFGMTIIEAFSVGLPVVASRQGAPLELVEDGVTGRHYQPDSAADLARSIETLWSDAAMLARMREASRAAYLSKYSGDATYQALLSIYRGVLAEKQEPVTV
jgi:glycosyltransferase involved in cell wall biosynthesis